MSFASEDVSNVFFFPPLVIKRGSLGELSAVGKTSGARRSRQSKVVCSFCVVRFSAGESG